MNIFGLFLVTKHQFIDLIFRGKMAEWRRFGRFFRACSKTMQLDARPLGIERICPHCGARFSFCQHCWRGHKYCSPECRKAARVIQHRIKEQRYSNTPKGRLSRKLRQKNFRNRKILEQRVTDPSSDFSPTPLFSAPQMIEMQQPPPRHHCRCCHQKLKIIKSVSEVSDTAQAFFSFTRYRKAKWDNDKKKMESKQKKKFGL